MGRCTQDALSLDFRGFHALVQFVRFRSTGVNGTSSTVNEERTWNGQNVQSMEAVYPGATLGIRTPDPRFTKAVL